MALKPTEVNLIIKQRLDQQSKDWNLAHGTNLSVSQYLNSLTGVTASVRQSLLDKYNAALASGAAPSTETQDIVRERLEQQVDDYNKGHGTNYSVEEYLTMLGSGDGATITQKTIDVLTGAPTDTGKRDISPAIQPQEKKKDITPPQITVIGITQAELDKVARAESQGTCVGSMRAYYTPTNYKITLRDGGLIFVKALSDSTAEQKAKDAGYDVTSVTRMMSWQKPEDYYQTQPAAGTSKRQEGLIKLNTGEWIKEDFYDALPDQSKAQLNELGVDKYNEWLLDDAEKNVNASGNQYLVDSFKSGGLEGYNTAVNDYNRIIDDAQWLTLYNQYHSYSESETFKDNWQWFQDTYADKLNDKKYMSYLNSSEFRDKYASIIQPSGMSAEDYKLIKPFINPDGFDSKAAYRAGEDNPTLAANIIRATNEFTLATLDDKTRAKVDKGEWTLLPYGQVIDTATLESMPPTYRNIVRYSGLAGYEAYQDKVLEQNKNEHWFKNTIDAIYSQSVGLGQDIKNYAILQLTATYPEVKEGDIKPVIDPFTPGVANVGVIGFTTPTINTYTAEEAKEINAVRADAQKYYKDMYDAADMAAQEWLAKRPQLQPVYAEGFVDSVKKNPSALKDPLLWTETMANTLPYTVATGLIAGGWMAGPAGLAIGGSLAYGITLSVEGHGIYKDAVANGASHDRALNLANSYGAISAAIETLGDTIFVGALGGVGAGTFAQALGKNTANNIVRGAAKKYGWKNLTAGMIKDFVNQGGQEFAQEVVHNAAIKTVNQNQALLENTANAFVSGVIGTAPFVLVPAGGQAIRRLETKISDVREGKTDALAPVNITPQMQFRILNKVFEPVSGFTVKTKEAELEHLKTLKGGIVQYLETKGKKEYEADKNITVGLVDKKTVVTGTAKVDEVALAYNDMCARVNEYANAQLKLKQALQAISKFGLAKSKSQLETLNEYKKRATELENILKDLKKPMVEAVQKFGGVFLKNSVGLEAEQKAEVRDMAKTIVGDIDSVTTQLFGKRDALEIAKDIKELEEQIKVIEGEVSKGVTRGQLEGYGRLINMLGGQIGDLVNELRMRYLAEGEKIKPATKKLTMEVMSLQARLVKAAEGLNSFIGSTLDYDVYRKGELAHEAEVLKLERDTFEAVQKTTEAIWGKESYASVLENLNRTLSNIISSMESLKSQHVATKAAFKIYDAIKGQDAKALKEGIRLLQLEAGKIQDKPLQLQAAQQVKLLETLTTENFWNRFKETMPKKKGEFTWYKSDEFESEQKDLIRHDAERIVALRFERITDKLPGYMKTWKPNDIMDYLRKTYDKQYFQDVHFGEFADLDEFLDVGKEEAKIRAEVERQEQLQALQNKDVVEHEKEKELTRKQLDKTISPKMKGYLNSHLNEVERELAQKKRELKTITKTKLVIPVEKPVDTVRTQEERGVAITPTEKEALTEKEVSAAEKAKAEARAAQRIRIAKQQIMKEGETIDKREENRESAFPGISPKTAEGRERERESISHGLDDYLRTMTLAQAIKLYEEEVGTQQGAFPDTAVQNAIATGIYAYTKAQAREQTKTQTHIAIRTVVKTALKEETAIATKEELETATKIITEIVTRTKTPPRVMIPPRTPFVPSKPGKERIPHAGPALAVWRQGMYWVSIFPPFRTEDGKPDVVYSRHKPPWGTVVKGKHSPMRSLRSIGKVPPLMELPMGVVTARVKQGRHLTFSRRSRRRKRRT